ncbi:hypothetical protein WISP_37402 [Willisornis vidua]|uniref:Uncharacterized protein n=1 Tax=Willisornis vidua TaxID=1566151 RepID=A0ABQ9DPA8_9PASS|nr:hypothetical protein WISP_37402 [Willisornis vidua]
MSEMEIGGCLGHSDHKGIEFKTSVDKRKSASSKTSALDMRRADFRLFQGYRARGSKCPDLEDHDCENDQVSVNPDIV